MAERYGELIPKDTWLKFLVKCGVSGVRMEVINHGMTAGSRKAAMANI